MMERVALSAGRCGPECVEYSIRVPEDFYKERQHIFNSFPWEENAYINTVFSKLSEL